MYYVCTFKIYVYNPLRAVDSAALNTHNILSVTRISVVFERSVKHTIIWTLNEYYRDDNTVRHNAHGQLMSPSVVYELYVIS